MSFFVGHGFLSSEISNSTIDTIQRADSPPHLSLWEKIKDFFFSTHQEEALQLLFDLYHPKKETAREDVEATWERLKKLASPGYETCFGTIYSNPDTNNFTIERASLTITIDSQENQYTIANGDIESRFTFNVYKPEKAVNTLNSDEIASNVKVKTPTEKEKASAIKIERYYMSFKRNLREIESKNEEFTKMVYNGSEKNINGRVYYFSRNYLPAYKPTKSCEIDSNKKGGFKHVISEDPIFVALAPNNPRKKFNTVNDFSKLTGLKTIKFGLAVSSELIIARNAGDDLFKYLSKNTNLPLLAFKNAVNDLKQLHERGVFLRDIKLQNLTYDYDRKQVNFIDVDDRLGVHKKSDSFIPLFHTYGHEVIFTPKYITLGLINNIYTNDAGEFKLIHKDITQPLKVADEYAFLMIMIATTTDDVALKAEMAEPKTDIVGKVKISNIENMIYNEVNSDGLKELKDLRSKVKGEYINPGAMNSKNKEFFTKWISENIKPENINSINLLLTNPAKYAKKTPNIHLADMLLFK